MRTTPKEEFQRRTCEVDFTFSKFFDPRRRRYRQTTITIAQTTISRANNIIVRAAATWSGDPSTTELRTNVIILFTIVTTGSNLPLIACISLPALWWTIVHIIRYGMWHLYPSTCYLMDEGQEVGFSLFKCLLLFPLVTTQRKGICFWHFTNKKSIEVLLGKCAFGEILHLAQFQGS